MARPGNTRFIALLIAALSLASPARAAEAIVDFDFSSGPATFAAAEIEAALHARHVGVHRRDTRGPALPPIRGGIWVRFTPEDMKHEGFKLSPVKDGKNLLVTISSADAGGAMYGGLELAEQIRTRGVAAVTGTTRTPYMPMRGTKFNVPLDLRTPSYTDMGASAQENIATVWDFDFWRRYLDALARDRYNYVSLWSLHPFPSMVKVPEYPDIALNDVWRSKITFDEDYDTNATGLVTPAMLADKEVVKSLTIGQKMDFWRRVMRYAKDRNIDFYVMTWNVYTYGVDGKDGITDSLDNPKTVDYFRASVREMFRAYPLLRGIGLTTGENMPDATFEAKENWAFATYGQGVLDAARAQPSRQFRLIHRQHQTRAQDIAATFAPLRKQPNIDFVFSFKYAQAHALSSTVQTFHHGYLESLGDLKTLWTIRNDDALMYRWAAPDFVREFVKNIPYEKSQGYYYGSDMWVWGREFLSRDPRLAGQLEIDKHWLHFLLWGRLGYDPTLDDERIAGLVGVHFPGVDGRKLLAAWQDASMIYPLVTGFHWADFDFQWYIEACRSRPGPARTASGFHSVETFIHQPVHPGTDNIAIPAYAAGMAAGKIPLGTTPLEVADRIDERADRALAALASFARLAGKDPELSATLDDLSLMAQLGKYYAQKIRGATELEIYRQTRDPNHQRKAVEHLRAAGEYWREYTRRAATLYRNPMWTNRVGLVDWRELDAEVNHDIEIAQAPLQ